MRIELKFERLNTYKTFGQIIRYNRTLKGYSLRDLGFLTNISHTLIANIENGKVVANEDTIKDLVKILEIEFYDNQQIIDEFCSLYNEAFNFLYEYEYTKATKVMNTVFMKEAIYSNSVVLADFYVLKYFYLSLTDQIYGDYVKELEALSVIAKNLTDSQLQMHHFINGIYLYNIGSYLDAHNLLEKALKVGDTKIDPLIRAYITKCDVKMFKFMNVVTEANEIIKIFEHDLVYLRAMELRLSIAYCYVLVKKYDVALEIIDKVHRFSTFYNAIYVLEECNIILSAIYLRQGNIELAKEKINRIKRESPYEMFVRTRIAIIEKKPKDVEAIYNRFLIYNELKESKKHQVIFEIQLYNAKITNLSDEEYVSKVESLSQLGVRGCDLEIIDVSYTMLINFYKEKRKYKKALEASEIARDFRRYGCGQ